MALVPPHTHPRHEHPQYVPVADLGTNPIFTGRNRIINGDFSVNQRAFTSATTDTTYGFDRWLLGKSGGTVTYSTQAPALGELSESARAFARVVTSGQSAAGDYAILSQRIESVRTLSGKTATVSFWAKAAVGAPKVAVEVEQNFGTTGSPSGAVQTYAGQVTLSTSWARYSISVAVPSIAGKTLGTAGNDFVSIALWTSAGSTFNARTGSLGIQSATIDIWGVQVEEGSVATLFEQKSYADELRACQRYYERRDCMMNNGQDIMAVCYNSAVPAIGTWQYMVPKRTAPTISYPTNGGARYVNTGGGASSGLTMTTSVNRNIYAAVLATSTNQTASAGWFDNFVVEASAEL